MEKTLMASQETTTMEKIGSLMIASALAFSATLSVPKEAASSTTTTVVVAVAAAKKRAKNTALNNYIVAPEQKFLDKAIQKGFDRSLTPYAAQCQQSMPKPATLKAEDVTPTLRNEFITCMKNEALTAQMTAETAGIATTLGMQESLTPYFQQCQKENNITPGNKAENSLEQITKAYDCMDSKHWEDIKSGILIPGGIILGGLTLVGLGYNGWNRRR